MDEDVKNWFQIQQPSVSKNDFEIRNGRIYYKEEAVESLTTNWPIVRVNGNVIPNSKLKELDRALENYRDLEHEDLKEKIRFYIHRDDFREYNF